MSRASGAGVAVASVHALIMKIIINGHANKSPASNADCIDWPTRLLDRGLRCAAVPGPRADSCVVRADGRARFQAEDGPPIRDF